ncbi:hypothetical protein ACFLXO_04825 [Chloroflexota bacterium]
MNSTLVLQEEEQDISSSGASSIKVSSPQKYWIPRVSLARLGTATTPAVIIAVPEEAIHTYFTTALSIDFSGFQETITSPKTNVVYENRKAVELLLDDKGKHILSQVIELIEDTSHNNGWPLDYIKITYVEDAEVENWRYVLITLFFDSTFEIADEYLHSLYDVLDSLSDLIDGEKQDILQRKLFFDVATAI